MAQDIFISILVYLCVFQNPSMTAVPVRDGIKTQDIFFSTECHYCGKLEKKIRRENGGITAKETKSKYIKNFLEFFHEYENPGKSDSFNYSILKGWGARGMPFNVLYTPNIHQQKIMKFVPQKQEEEKLKKEQEKSMPLIYTLVLEDDKPLRIKENTLKKHPVYRKYYSVIPQFFVSYGW